jgi:hypothetical protein
MYGLIGDDLLAPVEAIAARPAGIPEEYDEITRYKEIYKCSKSPAYFIHNYVKILDDRTRQWVPFKLYPAQQHVVDVLTKYKYIILLKSRQFGASTLIGGAYFLWLDLFSDNAHNLVLSKSEREAQVLMMDRFKPMFRNLPAWMKPAPDKSLPDSKSEFALSNGAKMFSLPTSAGDSYTARACMVDEAALVHNSKTPLSDVLLAVQPTIAAGGQLILVSKPDKSRPDSTFNSIFKAAMKRENEFFPIFVPWDAVPWRDDKWYADTEAFSISIDGTRDFVTENYPGNVEEALAPKELDKRLPASHIQQCFVELKPLKEDELWIKQVPDISNLMIYKQPEMGKQYIITADAAEGNPSSDMSCADVWDWETGEQVANLAWRYEPSVFGYYIDLVGQYFNNAPVFPERNNHGHSLINWLQGNSDLRVLSGPDSTRGTKKYGYNTQKFAKAAAYVELANLLREGEILIHKNETQRQLNMIDGGTLRAPKNDFDDHAISCMLFAAARKYVHLDFVIEFV